MWTSLLSNSGIDLAARASSLEQAEEHPPASAPLDLALRWDPSAMSHDAWDSRQFATFFGVVLDFMLFPDAQKQDKTSHKCVLSDGDAFACIEMQIIRLRLTADASSRNRADGVADCIGSAPSTHYRAQWSAGELGGL